MGCCSSSNQASTAQPPKATDASTKGSSTTGAAKESPPAGSTAGVDPELGANPDPDDRSGKPSSRQLEVTDELLARVTHVLKVASRAGQLDAVLQEVGPPSPRGEVSDEYAHDVVFALIDKAVEVATGLIEQGDVFASEAALMEAIDNVNGDNRFPSDVKSAAFERLRQSPCYQSTLDVLKKFEGAVDAVLGPESDSAIPWRKSAEIPVDYKGLEVELSPEVDAMIAKDDRIVPLFWRPSEDKKNFEVRLGLILPTQAANLNYPTVMGWIAMNAETQLHHKWHPIIHGDGPTELKPRQRYDNLWQAMLGVLFLKLCVIAKVKSFYNKETGSHVYLIEELPPTDPLWQDHPAPKGYTAAPSWNTLSVVCVVQEHTTYFGVHLFAQGKDPLPNTLVSILVSWVFPEILRRLLRAGSRALKSDGPHYPLIEEDALGTYGETKRFVENAVQRDHAQGGARYGPKSKPSADVVKKRARSLLQFEAER